MTKQVEFCFDVISPAAYIAWHILPKIAERAGAEILFTPIFLGGVMQATGNRPPGTVEAKGAWMKRDLARWAKMYGLPYQRNSIFPQKTLTHMRGVVAHQDTEVFQPLVTALYKALHEDDLNVEEATVTAKILGDVGLDPTEFLERAADQSVKDTLKANTDDAVARGVFGAPSFFVDGVMHWGQDRMFMVAEDLGTTLCEIQAGG
ncbi:MAG: 2-hydroxychromene-2-carboxylate isomerase [Pseudomonadota bacterium]